MQRVWYFSILLALLLVAAGHFAPIRLPTGYHAFADHSAVCGLHPFGDTASNLGFLIAGIFVWRRAEALYERIFAVSLGLICVGSWYYHLAPDDARLLMDRLPMAPAFAAMAAICLFKDDARAALAFTAIGTVILSIAAFCALGTDNQMPWVAGQVLILLVVLSAASNPQLRAGALAAFGLYVLAKLCETYDHQILAATGVISGHTLKHLLASFAPIVFFGLWRGFGLKRRDNARRVVQGAAPTGRIA